MVCRLARRGDVKESYATLVEAVYLCDTPEGIAHVLINWNYHHGGCFLASIQTSPGETRKHGAARQALELEMPEMRRRGCKKVGFLATTSSEAFWRKVPFVKKMKGERWRYNIDLEEP